MKEFLKSIGITDPGHYTDDNEYVVDIDNSDQYGRIFSKLEKSTKVHDIEDDSVFNDEEDILHFEAEKYTIELKADWEADKYSMKLTEKTEE